MQYKYGSPIKYMHIKPTVLATISLLNDMGFDFSAILPITKAARGNPSKNPNVGWKIYEGPPPKANIGMPIKPIIRYASWLIAPSFDPSTRPAMITNRTCNEKGAMGVGILMKAPIAVNAMKSAHRINFWVLDFPTIF